MITLQPTHWSETIVTCAIRSKRLRIPPTLRSYYLQWKTKSRKSTYQNDLPRCTMQWSVQDEQCFLTKVDLTEERENAV